MQHLRGFVIIGWWKWQYENSVFEKFRKHGYNHSANV